MIIIVTIITGVIFYVLEQNNSRDIRFNQTHVMKRARVVITIYHIQHFRPAHYAYEKIYIQMHSDITKYWLRYVCPITASALIRGHVYVKTFVFRCSACPTVKALPDDFH